MREKCQGSPRPPRNEACIWPSFRKRSQRSLFGAPVSSLPSLCRRREASAGDTGVSLLMSACRGGKCSYCPASVLCHSPRECSRRPPLGSSESSALNTGQLPGPGSEAGPSDVPLRPRTYIQGVSACSPGTCKARSSVLQAQGQRSHQLSQTVFQMAVGAWGRLNRRSPS